MGRWYELLHYPKPFQPNDSYNTTADYMLMQDGSVSVFNTTIIDGKEVTSRGDAIPLEKRKFHVEFKQSDVAKFPGLTTPSINKSEANYVIKALWQLNGRYIYAVVTDATNTSLWLLSRQVKPSTTDYEMLLSYVRQHFDRNKFVATPHY